eukprot:217964-Chlamydomonas_euryale.AAC.1
MAAQPTPAVSSAAAIPSWLVCPHTHTYAPHPAHPRQPAAPRTSSSRVVLDRASCARRYSAPALSEQFDGRVVHLRALFLQPPATHVPAVTSAPLTP